MASSSSPLPTTADAAATAFTTAPPLTTQPLAITTSP